jgi:hypothetical protein
MKGRYNVSYEDINELALPVLRHRIKLTFEAVAERVSADEIIKMIINELIDKTGINATKVATAQDSVASDDDKDTKRRGIFGRK